jgi:hypothetical protein
MTDPRESGHESGHHGQIPKAHGIDYEQGGRVMGMTKADFLYGEILDGLIKEDESGYRERPAAALEELHELADPQAERMRWAERKADGARAEIERLEKQRDALVAALESITEPINECNYHARPCTGHIGVAERALAAIKEVRQDEH